MAPYTRWAVRMCQSFNEKSENLNLIYCSEAKQICRAARRSKKSIFYQYPESYDEGTVNPPAPSVPAGLLCYKCTLEFAKQKNENAPS